MTITRAKPAVRKPRRTEELDTQAAIIELCLLLGYLVFHDNDPRRNQAGFPDLVIAGYGAVIVIELKTDRNEPTPEQRAWLNAFIDAGLDARVYRTSAWRTGDLANELKTIRRNWIRTHPRTAACHTTRPSQPRPRTTSTTAVVPKAQRGGRATSAASPSPAR
jgi:hypothetical protein